MVSRPPWTVPSVRSVCESRHGELEGAPAALADAVAGDEALERAGRGVVGTAFAGQIPARAGIKAVERQVAHVILADVRADKLALDRERAVDPRGLDAEGRGAVGVEVAGVNDVRGDVGFGARLVADAAAGGIEEVRAEAQVQEAIVGRMVRVRMIIRQPGEAADGAAEVLGGVAVFHARRRRARTGPGPRWRAGRRRACRPARRLRCRGRWPGAGRRAP